MKRKSRAPKLEYNVGCFRAANRILEKDYRGAFPIRYAKNPRNPYAGRAIVDAPLLADLIDEHTAASMLLTAAKAAEKAMRYWMGPSPTFPCPSLNVNETLKLLAKAIAQANGKLPKPHNDLAKSKGRKQ